MDWSLVIEILRGEPQKVLAEWGAAKADPLVTYQKCYDINNTISIVQCELKLTDQQKIDLDRAFSESYEKMQEIELLDCDSTLPSKYVDTTITP